MVVVPFFEAAIARKLHVLSIPLLFELAVDREFDTIAIGTTEMVGFDANSVIQWTTGYWERLIHTVIRRIKTKLAMALLQKGAAVDGINSNGVTALMMACGKVSPGAVRLLLCQGADPNSADGTPIKKWPLNRVKSTSPAIPGFPDFLTPLVPSDSTRRADKVVAYLISGGLRPSPGMWLERTCILSYMSNTSGLALRTIAYRLPTLSEVAIIQGRPKIRKLMDGKGGATFNMIQNDLPLPRRVKQQLKFDIN